MPKKVRYDETPFVQELRAVFSKIICKRDIKVAKLLLKQRKKVVSKKAFREKVRNTFPSPSDAT